MLIYCTAVLQWQPTIVPKHLLGPPSSLTVLEPLQTPSRPATKFVYAGFRHFMVLTRGKFVIEQGK